MKKTDYDSSIKETENKLPSTTGLITTAVLDCPISQEVQAIREWNEVR